MQLEALFLSIINVTLFVISSCRLLLSLCGGVWQAKKHFNPTRRAIQVWRINIHLSRHMHHTCLLQEHWSDTGWHRLGQPLKHANDAIVYQRDSVKLV